MSLTAAAELSRRALLRAGAGSAALGVIPTALHAQATWPTKPVMMMVGYGPGGQTDFAARSVFQSMQATLGQPVVIENKPGANGNIGAMEVLRSPADGHKLLVANGVMTLIPHTVSTPMADPLLFTPIGLMLQSALVLCVNPRLPAKTLAEFTASFIGLYGPAGLPADIVAKANAALNTALKDPAVAKSITDRGDEPGGGTPAALGELTKYYFKLWGDVAKANNIRAE